LATDPDAAAQSPQTIAVVANVSAVRKYGFDSPEAAIGQVVTWDRVTPPVPLVFRGQQAQIIGVVPDVPLGTVREQIQPTFFYVQPNVSRFISIKLTGEAVVGTVEQIDAAWKRVGHRGVLYERTFLDDRIERLYQGMIRQRNLFATL
jgi:putative ABC transport system permease protein